MVPDTALLNAPHYKIRIKGKMEQPRKWSSALLGVVAIKKGAFGLPSTKVVNLTLLFLLYRLSGDKNEMVYHIISSYSKLIQKIHCPVGWGL